MGGDNRLAESATDKRAAQEPDAPSAEELFCGGALARLCAEPKLQQLTNSLRERESQIAERISRMDPPAVCRACIDVVVNDMHEKGLSVPEEALANPTSFFQAVRSLPFVPSTAVARRRIRETARIIMLADQGKYRVPADVGELHDAWELAMLGEPRLSDSFPSSEFRSGPIALRGPLPEQEVLHECMDASEVPGWLERLIELLADKSMPRELRAACGLCLHDWIHPFSDGNGHVGRHLALATLGEAYTLPTLAFFGRELVERRDMTVELFGNLRTREADICGFCIGLLGQLGDAQAVALKVFKQ